MDIFLLVDGILRVQEVRGSIRPGTSFNCGKCSRKEREDWITKFAYNMT